MQGLRIAAMGSVSALALGAAGSAGAVTFQAGDTDVSIYGYVIGKASYDFDDELGDATAASFDNIITDDDVDFGDGHFDMDASQSRIGFTTDTDGVRTTFEGDMRGSGGGEFRLRHAFGEYMGFLAGQTWSNYNSFVGATPTIDFDGITGLPGLQSRRTQFRYTTGNFSVSVEDPDDASLGNVGTAIGEAATEAEKDSLPVFTARYESESTPLAWSVAAMAQEIGYEFDVAGVGDEDDSTWAYGAFAAVTYDLGGIRLHAGVNYSEGNQHNLYLAPGDSAYVDADGDVETIEGWGGTVGTSVDAGMGTFNVAYGRTEIDPDDDYADANPDVRETHQNAFVNYLWNPTDSVTYGVELSWWDVEDLDGDDGDALRLTAAAQYSF